MSTGTYKIVDAKPAAMEMEAPKTAADMARIYSAAQAKVTYSDGSEKIVPLHYEVLYRNVDRIGGNPYEAGRLYDAFGQSGSPAIR
jgi:hypothetical protein